MCRVFMTVLLVSGVLIVGAGAQDLDLDDRDLQRFEASSEGDDETRQDSPEQTDTGSSLPEATARYDQLIDRIKSQLRQVRIELRELPLEVERARSRLSSLRASEDELRRRAYERVVFRLPAPVYEDFDEALDEALERQAIRQGLIEEIEANEVAVRELEQERAALMHDLEQALRLKEEAREAAIESR